MGRLELVSHHHGNRHTMTLLSGSRRPRWIIEVLDRQNRTVRVLDGVINHSIELAATERLGGNATLELDAEAAGNIDWLSARVRFTYDPGIDGVDAWPLGVFTMSSPKESFTALGRRKLTVACPHLPIIVDTHRFTSAVTIPKGTKIVDWVVNALTTQVGIPRAQIAATSLGTVTASERSYDPKDSTLTIVNDLLTTAGYWSLRCDLNGNFVVKPWDAPISRAPMFEFTKDEYGITMADWDREQNLSNIPNRVVVGTAGSEEEPAIIGVAEITDPKNPYSIANRGVVSKYYDVEATDKKAANAQAAQRLDLALDPVLKVEVEHALVPLTPNDAVLYEIDGQFERFTVQRMSINGTFDAQCKATWRGVSGLEFSETGGDAD